MSETADNQYKDNTLEDKHEEEPLGERGSAAREPEAGQPDAAEPEPEAGEEEGTEANGPKGEHYYLVKFLHSSETLLCINTLSQPLGKDDKVVAPSRYGKDMAVILGKPSHPENYSPEEAKEIVRIADKNDIEQYEQNRVKEDEALDICKDKVVKHGLEMKLVSVTKALSTPVTATTVFEEPDSNVEAISLETPDSSSFPSGPQTPSFHPSPSFESVVEGEENWNGLTAEVTR